MEPSLVVSGLVMALGAVMIYLFRDLKGDLREVRRDVSTLSERVARLTERVARIEVRLDLDQEEHHPERKRLPDEGSDQ